MSRRPRKEVGGVQVRENKGRGRVEMGLWTLALVPFLWEGIAVCRCAGWHDCASVCLSPFSYAPPLFPLCLAAAGQGRGLHAMPCCSQLATTSLSNLHPNRELDTASFSWSIMASLEL
jgi:hypothetical protein